MTVPPRVGAANLFAWLAAWVVTLHAALLLVLPVAAVLGVKAPPPDGVEPDRPSTKPVARPGTPAPGSIGGIGEPAFIDRKASASDALREASPEALKLGDPCIDALRPLAREAGPVGAGGNTICRKFGKFRADLVKSEPNPLGKDDKRQAAQHRTREAAMPGTSPFRRNQPPFLVEAQCR